MHRLVHKAASAALCTALAFSGFLASPALAAKDEPLVLAPSNPWIADWGADSCALARTFGDAANPSWVRFEQFAPGPVFRLVVSGQAISQAFARGDLKVQYGEGEIQPAAGQAMQGTGEGNVPVLFLGEQRLKPGLAPQPGFYEARQREAIAPIEGAADSVTLLWGKKSVRFETGSLGKPFAMLHRCTDDLVRSWGLDPESQSRVKAMPQPTQETIAAVAASFPRDALMKGQTGLLSVRLLVDAQGQGSQCTVVRSYSDTTFSQAHARCSRASSASRPPSMSMASRRPPTSCRHFNSCTDLLAAAATRHGLDRT